MQKYFLLRNITIPITALWKESEPTISDLKILINFKAQAKGTGSTSAVWNNTHEM